MLTLRQITQIIVLFRFFIIMSFVIMIIRYIYTSWFSNKKDNPLYIYNNKHIRPRPDDINDIFDLTVRPHSSKSALREILVSALAKGEDSHAKSMSFTNLYLFVYLCVCVGCVGCVVCVYPKVKNK